MVRRYPDSKEIKLQFTKFHKMLLITVTISLIMFLWFQYKLTNLSKAQILTIIGMYLNFIGLVILHLRHHIMEYFLMEDR